MQTFIANCTAQRQVLNYRLPETVRPMQLTIPEGKQIMAGDLSPPEVNAILEQLGPYGLVPVEEIKTTRKRITYVVSQGKAVSAENMRAAFERNNGILMDEGKDRREKAAVASNMMMNTEDTPLNKLEMSVEEDTPGSFTGGDKIAEGVKIDNRADTSENKRPRPRGNRGN